MAFNNKQFLDYAGLAKYDELIKAYIKNSTGSNEVVQQIISDLETLQGGKDVEGSIAKQIQDAVDSIMGDGDINEALDTIKEIADWISKDEDGVAAIIKKIADNSEAIEAIKEEIGAPAKEAEGIEGEEGYVPAEEATGLYKEIADLEAKDAEIFAQVAENTLAIQTLEENQENILNYVDEQDEAVYDSITRIEELQIMSLFPVVQGEEESAAEAIAALQNGAAVKLTEEQTIAEDITIDKSCYIDANNSTFEGTVTVPAGVEVIIENATFAKPVVVA